MKKIALELQPCCGNRSGIGVYTYEIAKRLKSGGEFEFCGNVFNFCGRNDLTDSLQGLDMPIHVSRVFPYGVYRRIWHMLPVSYGMMFPNHADLSIFFNYIVPAKIKGKVITVVHDMTYLRYPQTLDKKNLRRIQRDIGYSLDRADRIVTVSEFSRQEIHELLGIPLEKISVVYNAASCSPQTEEFSGVAQQYGICKPYLLYVGNVEPRKNIVRLIQAFERLKAEHGIEHQLVLAGGKGWQNGELEQIVKESPVRQDIIFTGFVSQGAKNALYKNASAFVFPSLYEGFGIPPLEAMEMGCPVVCSNAASLPEVVGDAACLVNPTDTEDIAQGIYRVLTDDSYKQKLIENGYVQKEKFSWEISAQRMMKICADVLA